MFTFEFHFLGENESFKLLPLTTQIALICQNVLSMYDLKNVKLYDRAVSWRITTLGLPNSEMLKATLVFCFPSQCNTIDCMVTVF